LAEWVERERSRRLGVLGSKGWKVFLLSVVVEVGEIVIHGCYNMQTILRGYSNGSDDVTIGSSKVEIMNDANCIETSNDRSPSNNKRMQFHMQP
jgi:hypothetical protein